jgi:beta-phosphoglucomutase-like phosphatase (HAD superfamily)
MERKVTLSRSAYDAVIFDMDRVITKTAKVHFKALKQIFDEHQGRTKW